MTHGHSALTVSHRSRIFDSSWRNFRLSVAPDEDVSWVKADGRCPRRLTLVIPPLDHKRIPQSCEGLVSKQIGQFHYPLACCVFRALGAGFGRAVPFMVVVGTHFTLLWFSGGNPHLTAKLFIFLLPFQRQPSFGSVGPEPDELQPKLLQPSLEQVLRQPPPVPPPPGGRPTRRWFGVCGLVASCLRPFFSPIFFCRQPAS